MTVTILDSQGPQSYWGRIAPGTRTMIAKIVGGKGFSGAVRYVLDPDHRPEVVGGNMAGRTPQDLAREFAVVRQQRPDVEKPVHHVAISLHPSERRLTNGEIARLAEAYLDRMGWDRRRSQYVIVRHSDQNHQHVHVIASRIRLDGTLQPQPFREYLRSKEVSRELERDFGLRPMRERTPSPERGPTRGEDRMARDRSLVSEKERLKGVIREAVRDRPTATEFVRRLEAQGVQVRPNIARTGHVSGISFRLDRVAVKGSQLGRAYTWQGLQREHGLRYDPVRDLPALERAAQNSRGTGQRPGFGLARIAAQVLAAQSPEIGRAVRVARTGAKALRFVDRPQLDKALDAGVRLTGALDPRVYALAKTLGQIAPKPEPAPEYDPPIEREIALEPTRRDDEDR